MMTIEDQVDLMEKKIEEIVVIIPMVKDMHSLLIGNEYNKEFSLISQIQTLRKDQLEMFKVQNERIKVLEEEKKDNDRKRAIWMAIAGAAGVLLSLLLQAVSYWAKFKTH